MFLIPCTVVFLEEEFSKSRPEGCGKVGVQDGIDTGVGVGQHVGSNLKRKYLIYG